MLRICLSHSRIARLLAAASLAVATASCAHSPSIRDVVNAHLRQARSDYRSRQYGKAIAQADQAIKLDPRSFDAYDYRGMAYC